MIFMMLVIAGSRGERKRRSCGVGSVSSGEDLTGEEKIRFRISASLVRAKIFKLSLAVRTLMGRVGTARKELGKRSANVL
jgi:hypothetical protein